MFNMRAGTDEDCIYKRFLLCNASPQRSFISYWCIIIEKLSTPWFLEKVETDVYMRFQIGVQKTPEGNQRQKTSHSYRNIQARMRTEWKFSISSSKVNTVQRWFKGLSGPLARKYKRPLWHCLLLIDIRLPRCLYKINQ